MNPLAEELNQTIQNLNPHVFEMLSEQGKRFYFPSKGILAQSAEAKKLGNADLNATIGTAISHGHAMILDAIKDQIPGIDLDKALLYASSTGLPELQNAWREKTLHDNPDLQGKSWSLPVVTGGLSHALSTLADLLADEGDLLVLPDKNWGNYLLNFVSRRGAKVTNYPLFNQGGFNVSGMKQTLLDAQKEGRKKAIVLLNFPNNPTGYSPTEKECSAIADALEEVADTGLNLAVIVDDAYYGLFFQPQTIRQSLFTKLAGRHPRILAFKADAATKEVYVWGLRVGFIALSVGGDGDMTPLYQAINAKIGGIIRATVSNCSALSQLLVTNALKNPAFYDQRAANVAIIQKRALKVEEILNNHPEYAEAWEAYPFNSGYFMCLKIKKITAAALRLHLLKEHEVGTIAINDTDLRVAFSSVEEEVLEDLFARIYQSWKELA